MKKILSVLLVALLVIGCFASCAKNDDKPGDTSAVTTGGDVTTSCDETTAEQDESQKYALNPMLTRAYRLNDTVAQFRFDAALTAETDLTKCVYYSETEDGQPVQFAKTVTPNGEGAQEKWVAEFEGPLPETFYLGIKGDKDPDLKAVLKTADGLGVYANKSFSDGTRYTNVKNGDKIIIDFEWIDVPALDLAAGGTQNAQEDGFVQVFAEPDYKLSYWFPSLQDGILLLHDGDGKSALLIERTAPGGYAEFTFTGTRVKITNQVENDSVTSDLRVILDGEEVDVVDDRLPFEISFGDLENKEHTVKLLAGENTVSEGQGGANKYMIYITSFSYVK